ncbi:hypothetical protein V8E53_003205 [Lactarius tabidus]
MTPTFPPTGSAFPLLLVLPASQAKHCVGMSTPQAYYGAPPHLPFSQHSNAGSWGYGHYLPTPGAGPFLHPGEIQPINNATNQVSKTQVCTKVGQMQAHTKVVQMQVHVDVGQSQASNQPVPTMF